MALKTLIVICGAILLFSTLMTYLSWLKYKHKLIKYLFYYWITGLVAYIGQGYFIQLDELTLLAFGVNSFTIYYALKVFDESISIQRPLHYYLIAMLIFLLFGFLIILKTGSFQWGALIYCVSCFACLFIAVYKVPLHAKIDFFSKCYVGLICFAAFHFLDYPFLRPREDYAVIGFAVSLVFHFCYAIFVPILIIQKISSEYVRKLEIDVESRTNQLSESNENLKTVLNQLSQNKEKMDFLLRDTQIRMSTLVHDIANPLQVISTNVEVMSISKENLHQVFEQKSARLVRAVDTIMNILSDARKTHSEIIGKTELSLKSVDLKDMIQDCLKDFEDRLRKKNISVQLKFPEQTVCKALVHESWLRNQVLMNLISNAIKFSYAGGMIRLSLTPLSEDKISILIEDFGIGISKEKAETLFSLDQKTTTRGTSGEKGTGLGLPIVKQYLELMGGTVKLVQRQQPGAAFLIELNKVN